MRKNKLPIVSEISHHHHSHFIRAYYYLSTRTSDNLDYARASDLSSYFFYQIYQHGLNSFLQNYFVNLSLKSVVIFQCLLFHQICGPQFSGFFISIRFVVQLKFFSTAVYFSLLEFEWLLRFIRKVSKYH